MQLKTIGRTKVFWGVMVFVLLFYFAPGFSTLLTYRQSDVLHFKPSFIGLLGSITAVGGLLASVAYGFSIKKLSIRTMLYGSIATAAGGTLLYLLYSSSSVAPYIDFQNGFFFTLAEIAIMDIMARVAPVGCEGLAYSLLLSMRNLALFGADYLGAKFAETYKLQFNQMVWINAITTAIVLILIPLLPRALMRSRDTSATTPAPQGTPEEERKEEQGQV
jgi:predicted MFS family arabinose efflux permease